MESYNSTANQNIKRKLVEREVLCQVNREVEFILKFSSENHHDTPYSWDDVENMYHADRDALEYHAQQLSIGEEYELFDEFDASDLSDIDDDDLRKYLEDYHDFEVERAEPLEWWKVTNWFCKKLHAQGECVILHDNIWGRQTSGQSILLDGVISRIAEEMEILAGMKNEWTFARSGPTIITLDGGIIQDIDPGSSNYYEVRDYDTDGLDPEDLKSDEDGKEYHQTIIHPRD